MSEFYPRYNVRPGDEVFYSVKRASFVGGGFDGAFERGICYQVEIKLFKKPGGSFDVKIVYLVALEALPAPIKVEGSDLYVINKTNNQLVQSVPTYPVAYEFGPTDNVWVIDRANNGVKYGTVYQTEIKIHVEADHQSHDKTVYYVSFNDKTGTKIAKDDEVFKTSVEAWEKLGIVIGPPPTPTLPPDVTSPPGTGNNTTVSKTNGGNVTLFRGQPVYINQTDGTVALASNNASAMTFLGFVYDESIPVAGVGRIVTEGTINITNAEWNNILESGGTLMPGSRYYLASTGRLSASAPSESGKYSKQVGIAASPNELDIRNNPPIKL